MKSFFAGALAGAAVAALVISVVVQHRADWLSRYEFTPVRPPVPDDVLARIRKAETTYYADQPAWRRLAEHGQDALAVLAPALVYRLNLSVGRYRIKAATIDGLLGWAAENGYLEVDEITRGLSHDAIAYFAMQPSLNDWEAALYAEWLRQTHPALSGMSWDALAADPRFVAKIYSGYMGAGGDMEAWRRTVEPGPVALRRMGLE